MEGIVSFNVLADVNSTSTDDNLEYIDFSGVGKPWTEAYVMSPELGDVKRPIKIEKLGENRIKVLVELSAVKIYGVVR